MQRFLRSNVFFIFFLVGRWEGGVGNWEGTEGEKSQVKVF